MSLRKVYGLVDCWVNNTGLSGSLRLYTAKVGAVPGPTMSTRIGSDVLRLMAHLPPLPNSWSLPK